MDLQPAIAGTVSVLAGKDVLTSTLVAGGAMALAGVAMVQLRQ